MPHLVREHRRLIPNVRRKEEMIAQAKKKADKPRCGLCGKTKNLTKTECCGNWICDDEHKYVMLSYARNSCYRKPLRCFVWVGHRAGAGVRRSSLPNSR